MILQALYEYYQRRWLRLIMWHHKVFEWKTIVYYRYLQMVSYKTFRIPEKQSEKEKAKSFLVPQSEKRTVGIKANLLWDNAEYALGVEKDADKSADRHKAFTLRIKNDFEHIKENQEVTALIKFLNNNPAIQLKKLQDSEVVKEITESFPNVRSLSSRFSK